MTSIRLFEKGLRLHAVSPFLPQHGDVVEIEDRGTATVKAVYHNDHGNFMTVEYEYDGTGPLVSTYELEVVSPASRFF